MLELCYGYFISDNHKLMEEKSTRKGTVTEKSLENMRRLFLLGRFAAGRRVNSFMYVVPVGEKDCRNIRGRWFRRGVSEPVPGFD